MEDKKLETASDRYEQMDAEERKYEARRRVRRMVIIRVILAAMLVWVMFANDLPVTMIALLIGVIILILGTLIPVLRAVKTDLKYEDE